MCKIDFRLQFHQHFTSSFFVRKSFEQLFLYLRLRFKNFWWKEIGAKKKLKLFVAYNRLFVITELVPFFLNIYFAFTFKSLVKLVCTNHKNWPLLAEINYSVITFDTKTDKGTQKMVVIVGRWSLAQFSIHFVII